MNSISDYTAYAVGIFVVCVLLGGSFWGGYYAARRMVDHPIALVFLTLLFGSIVTVAVVSGLVAGCFALVGGPVSH